MLWPRADTRALLASGGSDGTVRLWDVRTHRQVAEPLKGPGGFVVSVAFDNAGRILAAGFEDNTIRLWDVAAHRELGTPLTAGGSESLAFAPDDGSLATSAADGTIRGWDSSLWTTDATVLRKRVCAMAGRNLSRAQWRQFLPGQRYRRTCPQWPVDER